MMIVPAKTGSDKRGKIIVIKTNHIRSKILSIEIIFYIY